MIWVDCLQGHIHFLPATKIQIEYFLWDATGSSLDQAWLDRLYKLNERVTPKKISRANYWRAFLTGIAPIEVEQYAGWCGDGPDEGAQYSLPTAQQWQDCYKEMQAREPIHWDSATRQRLSGRVNTLLDQLANLPAPPKSLADQMFLDGGVLEWVTSTEDGEYAAHGQTSRSWDFSGNFLSRRFPVKSVPKSPDDHTGRTLYYGFRLLRKEAGT